MFRIEWKTPDMSYYETTPAVFTTMEKAKAHVAKTSFWVKEWNWKDDNNGEDSHTEADDTSYFISQIEVDPGV